MFDLSGKVAVVTGSSRAIGRSIAEGLARAGARVVVSGRKVEACQQVVESIRSESFEAVAQACNVSDKAQLQGLIKTDFSRALWQNAQLLQHVERSTPVRRMGQPDDIGGVAVFLASKAAACITGQTLVVDGGRSVRESA
jgi:NAD(P)-dependent dehydrogenase (short-subunit alcohol dehydrogenase family)